MKSILILAALCLTSIASAQDRKLTGAFESVPVNVLMGKPEATDPEKSIFARTRQRVIITPHDITLTTGTNPMGVNMTYTRQGDFLLGKTMLGKTEMFYPVYVRDADTLFLAGQKFVRMKEERK